MTREEMCSALSRVGDLCEENAYKAKVAEMWYDALLYTLWKKVTARATIEMSLPGPQEEVQP